jgi:hypothetical protein
MIKQILLKIYVNSIANMQAQIAILRRLLWMELHVMAGPVLPYQY